MRQGGVIQAVQHVRRMRGGAQAHLMRAGDDQYYVVKFQNNPQHVRVLANEFLASRLAIEIGLPVPAAEIVEVDSWLIANSPELTILLSGRSIPCQHGLQFGSRYVVNPASDAAQVFDFLPETMIDKVKDLKTFAGMLAFDKWTANANGRQAAFWKKARERKYTVSFIDQGYCFNAGEWTFVDSPLRGVYARNHVYAGVTGWESFEPWLSRIEEIGKPLLDEIAGAIPTDWYGDQDDLTRLIEQLWQRRREVRGLIEAFRTSSRNPFPDWGQGRAAVVN
ncbi:MAG: HipA family kinase [Terriglobales bacterium]|jgi:hypothetical protein